MLGYCKLDPCEQMSVIFQSKYKIAIYENATENIVGEMASIFSNGRWVKTFFCGWSNYHTAAFIHLPLFNWSRIKIKAIQLGSSSNARATK